MFYKRSEGAKHWQDWNDESWVAVSQSVDWSMRRSRFTRCSSTAAAWSPCRRWRNWWNSVCGQKCPGFRGLWMSWHRTTGRHWGGTTTHLSGELLASGRWRWPHNSLSQTLQGMADRVNGRDDSVDQNCEQQLLSRSQKLFPPLAPFTLL